MLVFHVCGVSAVASTSPSHIGCRDPNTDVIRDMDGVRVLTVAVLHSSSHSVRLAPRSLASRSFLTSPSSCIARRTSVMASWHHASLKPQVRQAVKILSASQQESSTSPGARSEMRIDLSSWRKHTMLHQHRSWYGDCRLARRYAFACLPKTGPVPSVRQHCISQNLAPFRVV